jgi:hypothetical protein
VRDDSAVTLTNLANLFEGNLDGAAATHATTTVSLWVYHLVTA